MGNAKQDGFEPTLRANPSTSPWPPADAAPIAAWAGPQAGALLDGTYRILRPLGEGGMGIVLLARDEHLDREVAIKVIRPDNPSYEGRLIDEARAMARVHHRNVIEIYAFGTHAGASYFVMEYLPSETLDAWCTRHGGPPLPAADVLRILEQVCQGVAAIHASDTTHRDLKPANILIGSGFRVMVADLGLARPIAPRSEADGAGTVSGTPEYIAPEVATQRELPRHLWARADVYSLAVVAFELLTGRLPFESDSPMELMRMHALQPPPTPRSIQPELSPEVDDVLLKALAKDPVERTASVTAFYKALERALAPAADEEAAPPKRRSSLPPPREPSPDSGSSTPPPRRCSLPPLRSGGPPVSRAARVSSPPPARLGSAELSRPDGRRDPLPSVPAVVPLGAARVGTIPPPRTLRLLVADDDDHVRGIVARVLAKTFPDAVVESMSDGATVLASLEWHVPSLAILDLDMPGMNGLELVAALRSQPATQDMPVVVMTGTGTPSDLRLLKQLGARACLVKPFHPSQLVSIVCGLLGEPAPTPSKPPAPIVPR